MVIRFDEVAPDVSQADAYAFIHETVTSAEIVHVLGPIDLTNVDAFEKMLTGVVPEDRALVVDLSDCDYIGAAGFTVLVRSYKRQAGRFAVSVNDNGIPALLFSLFADREPFRVEHSLERAIGAAALKRM